MTIYEVIERKTTLLAHHPVYLPKQYSVFTLVNAEIAFCFSESRCTSKVLSFHVHCYRVGRPPNLLCEQYSTAACHLQGAAYVYGVSAKAYPVRAQRFDLATNRWNCLRKKPLGVSIRFISTWKQCLYLLSAVPLHCIEIYDTLKHSYAVSAVPVAQRTVLSFQSNGELFIFKENDTLLKWNLTTNGIETRTVQCPKDRLSQGVAVYQGKATWLLLMKPETREFLVKEGRFGSEGNGCSLRKSATSCDFMWK